MLKGNPANRPPAKRATNKTVAPPAGQAVPGIVTGPFSTVLGGDKRDQRESATRRAHRLRMKEFFSRAKLGLLGHP